MIPPTELQNLIQFPSGAMTMWSFQSSGGISNRSLKHAYWIENLAQLAVTLLLMVYHIVQMKNYSNND